MKKLFNKKKKLVQELHKVTKELDKLIEGRFGFNYSQTDCDEMIDTLDYGTNSIEYNDFIELMTMYKNQLDKGLWTPNS